MLLVKNVESLIKAYCDFYDVLNRGGKEGSYEVFKWEAAKQFKENWNNDVPDEEYVDMFKRAYKKRQYILDGRVRPIAGVLDVLKHKEEIPAVRECFAKLFVEDNGDLKAREIRCWNFLEAINPIIAKYHTSPTLYSFSIHYTLALLALWRPKENYFSRYMDDVHKCLNMANNIGTGHNFKLEELHKFCNELREEIVKNPRIIKLTTEFLASKDLLLDDDYHLLTYDVINASKYSYIQEAVGININSIIDDLKAMIQEEKTELEGIKQQIKEIVYPSLVNTFIEHKTYGKCQIVAEYESDSNNGKRIKIIANGETKIFVYDTISQYATILSEEYNAVLTEKEELESEIESKQAEIKELEHQLEKLLRQSKG